ncbi:hypothetical protein I551_4484 [Mycobacterium ulcerans str. Harvey]|uniref:Uncharacterized protein n=1 Tax=Mycobacterium ulcerans str. Harvey TaxID=1299332 RepID=A0ABP3AG64_MYCUL|nr:hypothetical protein I551_4484 [Mycobacterium ulcerans str. Harvey]
MRDFAVTITLARPRRLAARSAPRLKSAIPGWRRVIGVGALAKLIRRTIGEDDFVILPS